MKNLRRAVPSLLALAFIAGLTGCPAPPGTELDGLWVGTTWMSGHDLMPDNSRIQYTFERDRWTRDIMVRNNDGAFVVDKRYAGTMILDTTADPKRVVMQHLVSPEPELIGEVIYGVYDVRGNYLHLTTNMGDYPDAYALDREVGPVFIGLGPI